jgi:hypothetical protein
VDKRRRLKRERACNYKLALLSIFVSCSVSIALFASATSAMTALQDPPPLDMVAIIQSDIHAATNDIEKETIKPDPTVKFAEKRANLERIAQAKEAEKARLAAEAASAAEAKANADRIAAENAAKAQAEAAQKAAQSNNLAAESNLAPLGTFKATWYSIPGARGSAGWELNGNHVAMNDAQMRSLGLGYGDKVVVEFGRTGEKKTYIIADSGCGWGIVDIFVPAQNQIPSYGVDQVQVYRVA